MRALLAGGAGYVGVHTAVALLEAGHEVVLLDDLSNASAAAADRVARITGREAPLVVGDASDVGVVASVFDDHGPFDAIVHLAAFKAVGESTQKPLEYYDNNLNTTFALVRVGVARGIRSFLFSSTGTVYSDPASTTCSLVTMWPCASMRKPEPLPWPASMKATAGAAFA